MPRARQPLVYDRIRLPAVAERLTRARLALGLRPSEIADAIGLDRSTWAKCERGERIIGPDYAAKIAERYGVSMDYIYRGVIDGMADYELRQRLLDADPTED